MDAPDIEVALAAYLTAVLDREGMEDVPAHPAHRAEELSPFGSSLVAVCSQATHEAGPLWTATCTVLVTTPILPRNEDDNFERHRRLGKLATDCLEIVISPEWEDAILEATGCAIRGHWPSEATTYREEGRWNTAFQVVLGLEKLAAPETYEPAREPDTFVPVPAP